MKLFTTTLLAGLALSVAGDPALAERTAHTTTTVTRVHGPLKILPHHDRKICKVRWVHHKRVRKCYYH